MAWISTPEVHFFVGKYIWSNWDADELKDRAAQIQNSKLLELGLLGLMAP